MRLLNVQTLELKDFVCTDRYFPSYTILSHTWGDGEVSFQDLASKSGNLGDLAGYDKIRQCCAKSASEGFEYTWIDTCCIDKSSSAELSEAINSMFKWYSRAQVCYAYLSDVKGTERDNPSQLNSSFRKSRWFKRGWTLQELLAPAEVVFLNKDWVEIGTKSSLASVITSFTRIDAGALEKPLCGSEHVPHRCRGYSIAQKMCWATWRETTREEDRAYCLMGLFDVNMPLLYGEGGQKAFARLQSQIMKQSSDDSIFAWSMPPWSGDADDCHGYVAPSPSSFYAGSGIFNAASSEDFEDFEGGTLSTQFQPISTSYEETKDSLLLTAPILTFEEAPLIVNGIVFALEEAKLDFLRNGNQELVKNFVSRRANTILDSTEWVIAILGCRSRYGHIGVVLRDQKDGTYTRESHISRPGKGFRRATQVVGLQIRHLPQPQRIRIRQGGSVDSRCVRGLSNAQNVINSLAIILVERNGYALVQKYRCDGRENFSSRVFPTDPYGTGTIKYAFSGIRGPTVLALLGSPPGGVFFRSGPHFVLAFHWGPGTSPLRFRGFAVTGEAAASGEWKKGLDSESLQWDEAETRQFPLAENGYVGVRFRKGPVGRERNHVPWYLFVSILDRGRDARV